MVNEMRELDRAYEVADREPEIHISYAGRNYNFVQSDLDIGDLSTDAQIRQAISQQLEVPIGKMQGLSIARTETGDIIMRPQAVFGIR